MQRATSSADPSLKRWRRRLLALAAWAIVGCPTAQQRPPEAPTPKSTPAVGSKRSEMLLKTLAMAGLDRTALDDAIDPCEDFYGFACGKWIARTTIPSDKSRWGRSFSEIFKRNEAELQAILEEARQMALAARKGDRSILVRLGRYYGACMEEGKVEASGLSAIEPLLAQARRVRGTRDVARLVTELHLRRIWALFSLSAEQDFKNAQEVIGYLDQAGLGLPDRDYYLKDDPRSKKLRATYLAHVRTMLQLAGYKTRRAAQAAKRVMALETKLAEVSLTRVERRDPKKLYHRINRDGVRKLVASFDWRGYFQGLSHPDLAALNVTSLKFFSGLEALLKKTRATTWRDYLTWQILRSTAPALPKRFVDEAFSLRRALSGQKTQRPRYKRCVAATNAALGEMLSQPFVARRFAGSAKKAALEMVHHIGAAFGERVTKLAWMDEATKKASLQKLKKMAYLIGYPERWRKYTFTIGDNYLKNMLAARAFEQQRRLDKIGKPLDRDEWQMSPSTVNAYYDAQRNHMVFPAGILQPPFYDPKADVAVNMGAMGMVVGHELTHGFDDKGSLFDGDGNMRAWWTPAVRKSFVARTQCVVHQYAGYQALPGVTLNGALTAGENIADIAGVKLALHAYRAMRKGKTPIRADGYSEDQQFFLSVAQIWCNKRREAFSRMAAKIDPHSPPRFRVNGSLRNLPEFAAAFQCKSGAAMNPKSRCAVW